MSDHKANNEWWLDKPGAYWTLQEIRQLRKDLPNLTEFWEVFAQYEDPFQYNPGDASRHKLDRLILIDHAQPKLWYDSNPIVVQESVFVPKSTVASICKMAFPYGIAVIFDQGRVTLVGRREPVEMMDEVLRELAKRCQSMQSILPKEPGVSRKDQIKRWWSVFEEETVFALEKFAADTVENGSERIRMGFRKRVQILHLQHQVYQVSKSFRNWNPPEGSPEVVLNPVDDGGRLLGGVVWRVDTYYTQAGLEFLGLSD